MKKNQGSALILVLVLLGTMAAAVGFGLYITALNAQTTLDDYKIQENETNALSAAYLLQSDLALDFRDQVENAVSSYIDPTKAYYLSGNETALQSLLQQFADSAYCSRSVPDLQAKLYLSFSSTVCGEQLPPAIRSTYPNKLQPYFLKGTANKERTFGFYSIFINYPQTYVLPFIGYVQTNTDHPAIAAFSGSYQVDIYPNNYVYFNLVVAHSNEGTNNQMFFQTGEGHEGPILIQGVPAFNGTPLIQGRLYSQQGRAQFGLSNFSANEMVPNAQSPCYPAACPRIMDGVDWKSRYQLNPATINPNADLEIDEDSTVTLHADDTHTYFDIDNSTGTTNYRLDYNHKLERFDSNQNTWVSENNSFYVLRINGKATISSSSNNNAVSAPLTISASDIDIESSLIYYHNACVRVSGPDSDLNLRCDDSIKDNLVLISDTNISIGTSRLQPSEAWTIHGQLIAKTGSILVPQDLSPPAVLQVLGPLVVDHWTAFGRSSTSIRTSGVILKHYFDSRFVNSAQVTQGFGIPALNVGVAGVVPFYHQPTIIRE